MERKPDPLLALASSRKFLLVVFGSLVTWALNVLGAPWEMWVAIDGLIVACILGIALEDAADKARAKHDQFEQALLDAVRLALANREGK